MTIRVKQLNSGEFEIQLVPVRAAVPAREAESSRGNRPVTPQYAASREARRKELIASGVMCPY
jgi:hypothetical protein